MCLNPFENGSCDWILMLFSFILLFLLIYTALVLFIPVPLNHNGTTHICSSFIWLNPPFVEARQDQSYFKSTQVQRSKQRNPATSKSTGDWALWSTQKPKTWSRWCSITGRTGTWRCIPTDFGSARCLRGFCMMTSQVGSGVGTLPRSKSFLCIGKINNRCYTELQSSHLNRDFFTYGTWDLYFVLKKKQSQNMQNN